MDLQSTNSMDAAQNVFSIDALQDYKVPLIPLPKQNTQNLFSKGLFFILSPKIEHIQYVLYKREQGTANITPKIEYIECFSVRRIRYRQYHSHVFSLQNKKKTVSYHVFCVYLFIMCRSLESAFENGFLLCTCKIRISSSPV